MVKYLKKLKKIHKSRKKRGFSYAKIRTPIYEKQKEINPRKLLFIVVIIALTFTLVYKSSKQAQRYIDGNLSNLFNVIDTNQSITGLVVNHKPKPYVSLKDHNNGKEGYMVKKFKEELSKDYAMEQLANNKPKTTLEKLNQEIPNKHILVEEQHKDPVLERKKTNKIANFFKTIGDKLNSKHEFIGNFR